MVSLEMLAHTSPSQDYPHPAMRAVYGDRGDFIALVANGGHGIQGVHLSDHSPFWDQGYDALMVTLDLPFFCGVVEGLA